MKNSEYWANRMRLLDDALLDTGYDYVQNLEKQYDIAIAELDKKISAWYQRFMVNNELSYSNAKKLLNSSELEEFKWTIEQYISHGIENGISLNWQKQLENASARVHISRLESLKIELRQQAEELHGSQLKATESLLGDIYREGYYHTAFEIQKGLGFGWSMQSLNAGTMKKVLARPWTTDMQTFRDRCWTNKEALVNSVNTQLTQMIIRGEAPDKAIKAIAHQFEVSKSKAGRLVMTESAAFSSAAQKDCFNELGVEEYKIVETLDKETCPLCGALDGKVFKMSEYEVGTTAPPFHPWCRGCTAPYFADMEDWNKIWSAKDENGKTFTVDGNTTYKEWSKKALNNSGKSNENAKSPFTNGKDHAIIDTKADFSAIVSAQSGMTQSYAQSLEQRFQEGPNTAQRAFTKYVKSNSVADSAYTGTAHFNSVTGKVNMNFANDAVNARGAGATFFHEHGHYIDYMSKPGTAYASMLSADFGNLLRSDYTNYVKAVMKAQGIKKTEAYAVISKELLGDITHSVSDLFGGLSKNKCVGNYGHWKTSYWNNPGAVEKEAFAHMYEAQFSADKYALMKKYFPNALSEFERLLSEVVK